jgi:ribosomal protein L37AE/L43A
MKKSLRMFMKLSPRTRGNCPECHDSPMLLNENDFWECEKCGVQAHTLFPGYLSVLPVRGMRTFRQPAIHLNCTARDVLYDNSPRFKS